MQNEDERISRFESYRLRYSRMIRKLVCRYARTATEYDDLLQEAHIVLWRCICSYQQQLGRGFTSFLYQHLVWAIHEWIRANRYPWHVPQKAYRDYQTGPATVPLHELIDNREHPAYRDSVPSLSMEEPEYERILDRLSLQQYLGDRLNRIQYCCVVLYFGLDGESYTLQEIGDQLGISKQAVHQHIQYALKRLRKSPPDWLTIH